MSPNERTVERCRDASGRADRAIVVACVTDDVAWRISGA